MADVLAGENPTQAIAYLQEALQLTDSLHSQRAEDLAVELRKSQAEALAETTQQGAATASHPPLHILLLLTLTAAIGIVGALWWGIRHAAATKEKTKSLTDEQDLPIPENTRKTQMSTRDIQFLAQVSEIYDRHLSLGRLDIDELASEMCMSRSQFTRRMTALTGMAASNYFNRLRIEKACRLLKDTEKPVNIISEECGFEDPSYFGSFFKKTLHVTPMQYRIMPKTD
jgi:AraC-like DNA-binding protein